MPRYYCPKCGASNSEAGKCVVCLKPIGSVRRAIKAAIDSTLVMIAAWAVFSAVTRIQIPLFGAVFGACVAGWVTHYSGGRGIVYQLIATSFTIVGVIVGQAFAVILFSLLNSDLTLSTLTPAYVWSEIVYRGVQDPITMVLFGFGVFGSLFIWKS